MPRSADDKKDHSNSSDGTESSKSTNIDLILITNPTYQNTVQTAYNLSEQYQKEKAGFKNNNKTNS